MNDTRRVRRQESLQSPEYTELKAKDMTISPKIAKLVNQCKAKRMKYRFVERGVDEETHEDFKRMTIVVDHNGGYLSHYFG